MKGQGKATPPPPPKGKGKGKGPQLPVGPAAPPPPRGGPKARAAPSGPKLRPLFWQAVAEVSPKSVWNSPTDPVAFDQTVLERCFALAETRTLTRKGSGVLSTGSLHEQSSKRVRLLDDRTSQRLAIAFNKLPPPEKLHAVIDELDEFPGVLPVEALLALNTAATEQQDALEQIRQLQLSESDLAQLDLPERYLWVLATKPLCAAKIACGAIVVGPARELPETRQACESIQTCCKELRSSQLVMKCVSTCLAVGNVLNRGTARSGARGVVLPDALLKMDELRGMGNSEADGARAPSVLDFVADALVRNEVVARRERTRQAKLQAEALALRDRVRAAQGVDIQEADASCRSLCQVAAGAHKVLSNQLVMPSEDLRERELRLGAQVQQIIEEGNLTAGLVEAAKEELKLSLEWSSTKAGTKSSDWLGSWGQFLDQLATAISRVAPPEIPPEIPSEPEEVPSELWPMAARTESLRDITNASAARTSSPDEKKSSWVTTRRRDRRAAETVQAVQLDDDERVEVLLAKMATAAPGPAALQAKVGPSTQHHEPARVPAQIQTRVPLIYSSKENISSHLR